MTTSEDPTTLEQLLDRIRDRSRDDVTVTVEGVMESVGPRSFGPILILAGLIVLAPLIGDIPGVPTLIALLVLLTVGQIAVQRDHIWLPSWLARRHMSRDKLVRGTEWLRKPARFIDRLARPRLTYLVTGPGLYVMVTCCIIIALAMPAFELIPFSANGAGLAFVTFGLAIIARDGVIGMVALLVMVISVGSVIRALL
ncbi:exopolysaccharide biosynthesis protein [Marinobacter salicampi]|uniref:exopolysaccharide biosynthesis protein n=1 Tax=Marinobacter salicampi TaxID=435907 RepID=UPI00140D1CDC|nr:exopolysaccharide biosynthesis protein [Marinobacter salicampi]